MVKSGLTVVRICVFGRRIPYTPIFFGKAIIIFELEINCIARCFFSHEIC